ncbi:MAG: hypothetical protein WC758_03360 [Candidatus Woesearchaeota archaeon]
MSLGQIITEAAMIAKLAFASPDTIAVEQNNVQVIDTTKTTIVASPKINDYSNTANPFNINLETGITSVEDHPVKFQRVQLSNKDFEIKYDFNSVGKDVTKLKFNLPKNFNFALYDVGDLNGKDVMYFEASKVLKFKNNSSVLLDGGMGASKGSEIEYFLIANFKNDKLFFEGAIYETASKLKDLDKSIYALAAYDFGHAYVGAGKNKNTLVGVAGVKNFKDLGMITFVLYDKETKGWSFISQTAVGNTNQNFFTKNTFDFVTEYFSIPSFFPTHFTPQVTKGDYSLKVNGAGTSKKTELEGKFGWNNKIVPISVGVNTLNENGETNLGAVVELYKPFHTKNGMSGYVEMKYNTRSKAATAYVGIQIK